MNYLSITKAKIDNFKSSSITSQNIQEKINLVKDLKISMLQFNSLPPSPKQPIVEEFIFGRDITEFEMEIALALRNEKSFELAYLQVKQFYFDFNKIITNQSEKMFYYIGLYLGHLLSNNRTTDFSTEVELLKIKDLENQYIKISLSLERAIMEGNYKYLEQMKSSTDQYYNYYLGKFDDTIKFQIARSAEKSYDSGNVNDAIVGFMLKNEEELSKFINEQNAEREDREIDWKVMNGRLYFTPLNKEKATIPAFRIISDAIHLGIEMEKII